MKELFTSDIDSKTMQELKNCELEMLKAFIDACQKLDITYYLMGGTLLGAVRHEGFIPWDDDIDVGLKRKDYELFIKGAKAFLPEYFFVQTFSSDPEYPLAFAKLRDCRTTFIETAVKNKRINHGVFIDIFPLDVYPDNPVKQKMVWIRRKVLKNRIQDSFYTSSNEKRSILGCIVLSLSKVLYPSVRSAVNKMDHLFRSQKGSHFLANYCGAWGQKEVFAVKWLNGTSNLIFENIHVTGPKDYDAFLKQMYGDYMRLPPVEKRVSHHYTEIIDLNKPYHEYN